ncbi:MAG TPA: hypothetical protein PK367_01060 [Candidatus Paceibacterota bacterium]|nr:hypothetical protein [Candidatus Paceibacterota bacterium]
MIVTEVLRDNPRYTEMFSRSLNELEVKMNAKIISVIRLGSSAEGSLLMDLLVILRVNEESERPA